MSKISTVDVSKPNVQWGICGFAAAIGALHENKLITATVQKDHFKTRLLAEIKTYLVMLQADNSPLIQEIQAFTRTFNGFGGFTVAQYIQKINNAPVDISPDFSIAMTPKAVVDYLKRMYEMKCARLIQVDESKDNVIVGFADGTDLKHWVYKKNTATAYNWGKQKSFAKVKSEVGLGIGYMVAIM